MPKGSTSDLFWVLVLAYAWTRKRAVSSWKSCAGGHGWVPLGASVRSRTGTGMRSIAARPTGATGTAGLQAGRSGSARRVAGPNGRACPSQEAEPALDRSRNGFPSPIPSLADRRGHPLLLRVTAARVPRPHPSSGKLGQTLRGSAWDGNTFCAGRARAGLQGCLSGSGPAHERTPSPMDLGTFPGAPRRGTGPRWAPTRAGMWLPAMLHTHIVAWVFCT